MINITFLTILIYPFLVMCSVLFSKGSSLYDGDHCVQNNRNGDSVGKCISAYDCPWALKEIQRRNHVDICYYNRKVPVICCPMNEINQNEPVLPSVTTKRTCMKKTSPTTTTSTTESQNFPDLGSDNEDENPPPEENLPIRKGAGSEIGRISKEKCNEYYPPSGFDVGIAAVGGEKTLAEEFPHMAILGYGEESDIQWKCGGSLISLQHILTAAHCSYSRDFGDVKFVRLGDVDILDANDGTEPQNFTVKTIIQHPEYESKNFINDIAILELDRPVKLTKFVKPACLHTDEEIEEYAAITATGWGLTQFDGEPSSHLLKVTLTITEEQDCSKQYEKRGKIDFDKQICAGSAYEHKIMDTCQGDSGGPLQKTIFKDKHYLVLGVTSFGKACGITKSAGVYTRVSHYVPWIESIVFK